MRERVVAPAERERYLAGLRAARARCEALGVHFWAFEHERDPERFVEFAEAKSSQLLDAAALDEAPPAGRWRSLELR